MYIDRQIQDRLLSTTNVPNLKVCGGHLGARALRLLIARTAAGMAEAANQPAGKVATDNDTTPFTAVGKPQGEQHFDPDAQVATYALLFCRVSSSTV